MDVDQTRIARGGVDPGLPAPRVEIVVPKCEVFREGGHPARRRVCAGVVGTDDGTAALTVCDEVAREVHDIGLAVAVDVHKPHEVGVLEHVGILWQRTDLPDGARTVAPAAIAIAEVSLDVDVRRVRRPDVCQVDEIGQAIAVHVGELYPPQIAEERHAWPDTFSERAIAVAEQRPQCASPSSSCLAREPGHCVRRH